MVVNKLEEWGRVSVQEALHLPVEGKSKGWENHTLRSLIHLINKGDEHAKTERLLGVSLKISAPKYIWSELDTYTVGVTPGSSSSTMYTLLKTLEACKNYKDLIPLFDDFTDTLVIERMYELYLLERERLTDKDLLRSMKAVLPEGFIQTRVRQFTYQTLRRIYKQRRSHRLQWWASFFAELIPQLNEQRLIAETWEKTDKHIEV